MNIEELREYCLTKKAAEETFPFDDEILVFKIGGKAFLLCGISNKPLRFNVKCDPELAVELREKYDYVLPGYHMNKKHWNTIVADDSSNIRLMKEWIDHSYELVLKSLPKAMQEKIAKKKK